MRKLYPLLVLLCASLTSFSQTYFSENFETAFTGNPAAPVGWSQSVNNPVVNAAGFTAPGSGGDKYWQQNVRGTTWAGAYGTTPSAAQSGTGALWIDDGWFSGSSIPRASSRVMSPVINLSTSTSPYLRFWYFNSQGAGVTMNLRVLASADGGTTWTVLTPIVNGFNTAASTWNRISIAIPATFRTANMKFAFEITNLYGSNNPFIDDVIVEEYTPTTITSAQTGDWNATTTWAGGVIPTADNDVVIAAGHTVTLPSTTNIIGRCQNLTINGTLSHSTGTANIIHAYGNITVNGTLNAFNGTSGRAVYVGGNFTINSGGTANLSVSTTVQTSGTTTVTTGASTLVWLGNQPATFTNNGTLTNGRINNILHLNPGGVTYNSPVNVPYTVGLYLGAVNPNGNLTLGNSPGTVTQIVERANGSFTTNPIWNNTNITSRSNVYYSPNWVPLTQTVINPGNEVEVVSGNRNTTGAFTLNTHNNLQLNYPLTVGTTTTGSVTFTRGILMTDNTNLLILNSSISGSSGTAPSTVTPPTSHGSYVVGPIRINFPSTGTTSRNFPIGLGTSFNSTVPSANINKPLTIASTTAWSGQTITATIGNKPTGNVNAPLFATTGKFSYRLNLNGGPDLPSTATLSAAMNNYTFGNGVNSDSIAVDVSTVYLAQGTSLNGTWEARSNPTGTGFLANNTNTTRTSTATIAPLATNGEYFAWGTSSVSCSGLPDAANISGPSTGCVGNTVTFTATGINTQINGVKYRWQTSTNGINWTNTTGTSPASFTATLTGSAYFRLVDTCTATGDFNASNELQVTIIDPDYAALPYTESFEADWQDGCGASGSKSIPNNNWRNTPTTGNNSWRRNDQGTTAAWTSTSGAYSPASSDGAYSARFHTFNASSGTIGNLDVHVNCSTGPVTKSLSFSHINTSGTDSTTILLSTDGGINFIRLDSITTSAAWRTKTINFTSSSATTVIRFSVRSDYGSTDVGIDNVNIIDLNQCSGAPTAGTVTGPSSTCTGSTITLTASGYSTGEGGLTYRWQTSTNGVNWTNTNGTNPASFSTTINGAATTYFRLVDTCTASGLADSTAPWQVDIINPDYAALPFTESFEADWQDGCGASGSKSIPNNNWRNTPTTGNNSWRRNDQGTTAAWTSTSGAYSPVSSDGAYSARFHSYNASSGTIGNLDVYVNCSTGPVTKSLSFSHINTSGTDSTTILLSTDGGINFIRLDSITTSAAWRTKTINFTSSSATTVIRFSVRSDYGSTDVGIDNVNIIDLNQCSGAPTAGTVTGPSSTCTGSTITLTASGYSTGEGGLTYRWQTSTNGVNWTNTNGTNPASFSTTINGTATTYFRLVDTCTASGLADSTAPWQVDIINPDYAALPFTESFESTWVDGCGATGSKSIPNNNWRVNPISGNTAWRRNDDGASAAWTSPTYGAYTPAASPNGGTYSARFHSSYATGGTTGSMDLFLDCSTGPITKNISFDYINTSGSDSVVVLMSTNGGSSFVRLDSLTLRGAWATKSINFNSLSAITVIRFIGYADYGATDIGLDNINVIELNNCSGTPTAGTVNAPAAVCSAASFTLSSTGYTSGVSGMTYRWQESTDSITWVNTTGVNPMGYTTSQTVTKWYRLVDTCTVSGSSAISNAVKITINPANLCYCSPVTTGIMLHSSANAQIAQVEITSTSLSYNSGSSVPTNGYTLVSTSSTTGILYTNSSYTINLTLTGTSTPTQISAWIDWNANGSYESSEYYIATISGTSATITFSVPANAAIGATGLRIRSRSAAFTNTDACSSFPTGETEDYTIQVQSALPVTIAEFTGKREGSINKLQWITATEVNNAGFEVERSTDGNNFSKIAFVASQAVNGNSNSKLVYNMVDETVLSGGAYYRLKQLDKDGKSQYSKVIHIKGALTTKLDIVNLYPNPVKHVLNVAITAPSSNKVRFVITDLSGRTVAEESRMIAAGENIITLNTTAFIPGTYIIKAVCADGCETAVRKFIKQ